MVLHLSDFSHLQLTPSSAQSSYCLFSSSSRVWMEATLTSCCSHRKSLRLSDTCGLYFPSASLFYSTSQTMPVIISNLSTHVSHNEANEVSFSINCYVDPT